MHLRYRHRHTSIGIRSENNYSAKVNRTKRNKYKKGTKKQRKKNVSISIVQSCECSELHFDKIHTEWTNVCVCGSVYSRIIFIVWMHAPRILRIILCLSWTMAGGRRRRNNNKKWTFYLRNEWTSISVYIYAYLRISNVFVCVQAQQRCHKNICRNFSWFAQIARVVPFIISDWKQQGVTSVRRMNVSYHKFKMHRNNDDFQCENESILIRTVLLIRL